MFAVVFVSGFVMVPDAQAQCPGSGFTATGFVDLISCTEAKQTANATTVTIPVPAATALGDLLVAVVMTDGNEDINGDGVWTKITEVTAGNNDGTLGLWKKISDGAEPADYTFTWGTIERAIGYMMRFTGADGDTLFATASGQNGTGAAVAPNLVTAAANTLILRIFGQDDDDFAPPADDTVVAGYETITEDESTNNVGGDASSSAAFINQAVAGATGTATFAGGGNEQWAAITLGIEEGIPPPPPTPPFECPALDGTINGAQLVVMEECTHFQGGDTATAIDVPAPAGAVEGDLLIAVINTDGNELPFAAVPAGWVVEVQTEGSGITQAVYSKIVTASEPGTYSWTLATTEQRYGYLMHFTGASGLIIPPGPTTLTGTSTAPNTPALTTTADNTLVLRIATSDDDDAPINPADLIIGYENVTSNSSSLSGTAVSGQAAYFNQETAGLVAAETFPLDASEFWRGTAIGIEPMEFLFSHSLSLSTCAIEEVTISAVDSTGAVITGFTGTVNLSTSGVAGGAGTWAAGTTSDTAEFPGNLDNTIGGSTTNGQATYTFTSGDAGSVTLQFTTDSVGTLSFDLQYDLGARTFTETPGANDPTLTVDDNCSFRISHDGSGGTCGIEPITITIFDSSGTQATNYTGTIDVTLDSGAGGNFSVNTGTPANLNPINDNDNNGAVQYTFDIADGGQVILDYENLTAQPTINFDVTDERGDGPGANDYLTDGGFDPDLALADCEFRIIVSDTTRDVCSSVFVTFEVRSGGNLVNYVGDMDITTSGGVGDWFINGEPGTLDNLVGGSGNGQAEYTWNGTEGGSITLDFRSITVDPAVSFSVSGTAANGASVVHNLGFNPAVDIAACNLVISTPTNTGDICRAGLTVIYTITDRDAVTATGFNGLLVLQTSGVPNIGDYELAAAAPSAGTGGFGTFDNGASNDGVATYQFDAGAGDAGVLEVLYSIDAANSVSLTASSSGVVVDDSDGNVTFNDCEFRITYIDATPGVSDVCSTEIVRIELVDSGGLTVDDYNGTILLSTNTSDGTWAVSNAEGVIFDPTPEDGEASYTFIDDGAGGVTDDDGVIDLVFTHAASNNASVNIDITDGTTTDPGNPGSAFDPNLNVALCQFEISYDGGATNNNAFKTACEIQQVTIGIYRSAGLGGGLATDYTGEVNISTSTDNGNWAQGTATGLLVDTPGDDDGAATYTYNGVTDGGEITLDFTNLNTETMTVDVVDQIGGVNGVIVEAGSADPTLEITSCTPGVDNFACDSGASPLTAAVTIDAQNTDPSLRGRMVVVATSFDGEFDVTGVTFDASAMTLIREERAEDGQFDNMTQMWGMLDTDLPAGAGSFSATVTHSDPDAQSMCVFYLTDVEQVIPTPVAPAANGPVNGAAVINPTAPYTASTTITTTQNNALVLSMVSNSDNTANGGDFTGLSPSPPLTRLFNAPDPGFGIFAGSSGIAASAAALTVDETPNNAPIRFSHVVAAFNPLITGPPVAVGFEPVVLFQTYSGDISYRTIGASLRTQDNDADSCVANNFADANLSLPEVDETGLVGYIDPVPGNQIDSSVIAAYLYWFGSGDISNPPGGVNFDQATFILDPLGAPVSTAITADELFSVENVGGGGNLDYFAAYKDVTSLVNATGSTETYRLDDHPAQFTTPWSTTSACGGGWALVVVYSNPFEQLRVINLFHGFQPFQNSAFTLIPRNFRMASPNPVGEQPNGQITHVTLEGDYDIDNGDESLKIQDTPGSTDPNLFIPLATDYNPLNSEFNSTITRPVFQLVDLGGGDYKYQWDSTANGVNQSNGYEIDFPGDQSPDVRELGGSWGVDADTHYISGDEAVADVDDNVLFPFANTAAEEITTRYSSGQDLVLLVSEVISTMNAPIADLEVFLSETSAPYQVNNTGTYQVDVTNNGNNAASIDPATGNITVTGVLPTGMTFGAAGDVAGTGWTCIVTLDPGAFTCDYDIEANIPGGLLLASVDPLNFTVQIAGPQTAPVGTIFPSLSNDAKVIVRMQHNERDVNGACPTDVPGVMPDPNLCKSPEFDNVNDLQGGVIDIDTLEDKTGNNNNVDSVTTEVRGIENNLGITKTLVDVLEPSSFADFTITVTNFGPDDIVPAPDMTTPTITVTDTEPSFIQFDSATPDAGWTCDPITNPGSTNMNCNFSGTLLAGNSTSITLTVEVTGTDGDLVNNTAAVSTGTYNFDPEPEDTPVDDPDSDSDGGTITNPPAAATERFLMSVSSALGVTTLGSGGGQLVGFEDDDLIIFDPVLDEATMFLDNSAEGFGLNDINAVHLLPTGEVVLSTETASTVGDNVQAFDANDLAIYNPITRQAALVFDGDSETETTGVDIDAVYVIDPDPVNPVFIFSTASDVVAGIGWSDADLVLYNAGVFSIYLDAEDPDVFDTSTVNIDAMYIRVDDADANLQKDNFVVSSADEGVTAADDNGVFGRDDVIEVIVDDNSNPDVTSSDNLFAGNIPIGVFSAVDPLRRISALHVLEDGYLGHFSIVQSQAGSACTAGQITIRKHEVGGGGTHQVDTDFGGTVIISLDVVDGDWSIAVGNGTLDNGIADDGIATYTFDPDNDNGEVTLNLDLSEAVPVAKSVNIDVSNSAVPGLDIVRELGTEDPTLNYNLVITSVTYADNFDISAFNNNDGSTGWDNDWQEIDGFDGISAGSGAGAGVGNVQISGSTLSLTSNPNTDGNFQPSLSRDADFSLFNANQTTFLDFDYTYSNLNIADQVIVEVSDDGGSNWETAADLTGLSGTNGSTTNVNVDLSALGGVIDDFTGTFSVRFRVANGYTLASTMFIHNVELATGTTDCGIGVIDHYHISLPATGVACVAVPITISGHDANHFPAEPGNGTVMNLATSTGSGTWSSIVVGAGTLVDIGGPGTNTDGQGTYTYFGSEETIQLLFNYTDPAGLTETVNINATGSYSEQQVPDHDPSIDFDDAGIVFFDETGGSTTLPFQIAGKPSLTLPSTGNVTLQIVRSVDRAGNEAAACESLVGDGTTATIKLAGLCDDPATCAVANMSVFDALAVEQSIPVFSSPTANPEASGTDVDLLFNTQSTIVDGENNIAAVLDFSYPDAGQISLHGQFEIPLDNNIAGVLSGDTINGASMAFAVRPFGIDIDFSGDRRSGGSVASLANDHTGPAFARAGAPFDTTIAGVVYDPLDDDQDNDGLPDSDADLSDNAITPNFGNETTTADYAIQISVDTSTPGVPGGANGAISSGYGLINNINNGVSGATQSLAINEVGIFDLDAVLVDDISTPSVIGYLGAPDTNGVSAGITGRVNNVGRIYPNHFDLVSSSFGPRVNQNMACSMGSTFTYLGEDFGLNMVIQAKNQQGDDTTNYRDDFAKLTAFSELDIRAIIDEVSAADNDLGAKLVNSSIAANFSGAWVNGQLTISGDMNIARQGSGAEEAPLTGVQIVFGPIDDNDDGIGGGNDVILDLLDVDLDDGITEPGTDLFKLIDTHEFRYGRLIIENAFGPETEDLGIPFGIEYFNGTEFITNSDDSCTSFLFDVGAPTPALTFIGSSYEAPLQDGDTAIEQGELVDVEINVFGGQTNRQQDGDTDDDNDPDRPFITSAPDPLADQDNNGRVLVEFDLNNPTLTAPLDFLSYDWRGDPGEVDDYDEIPDNDYGDNPRGVVEFGSYRGHDRVINWQEIYIGN